MVADGSTATRVPTSTRQPADHGVRGRGRTFPDALAAGAATGTRRGAVLLTRKDALPAVAARVVTAVSPPRIVVVGGTGVVSAAVVSRLRTLAPTAEVLRSSGADRYATAAAVSRSEFVHPGNGITLASGEGFADAFSAAAFGSVVEHALLLTEPSCARPPRSPRPRRTRRRWSRRWLSSGSGARPCSPTPRSP